jgi:predicted outer membrane repeat protein
VVFRRNTAGAAGGAASVSGPGSLLLVVGGVGFEFDDVDCGDTTEVRDETDPTSPTDLTDAISNSQEGCGANFEGSGFGECQQGPPSFPFLSLTEEAAAATGVQFQNNRAYRGGAVAASDGALFIAAASIAVLNHDDSDNGGGKNGDNGGASVSERVMIGSRSGPLFQRNGAFLDGGAIYANAASVAIVGTVSVVSHPKNKKTNTYTRSVDDFSFRHGSGPRDVSSGGDRGSGGSFMENKASLGGSVVHALNGAKVSVGSFTTSYLKADHESSSLVATVDETTQVEFSGNDATYGGLFSVQPAAAAQSTMAP